MKSSHILSIVLLISALLLSSCFEEGGICVNADGNRSTQSFDLPAFSGVKLATVGKVNLIPGEAQSVEITGSENIVDLLKLDIDGDVLKIGFNRCTRNTDLIFDITLPELTAVGISGSGTITTKAPFEVDKLDVDISGSGNIFLEVTADQIETGISGSGDMTFVGTTNVLDSRISGSGDLHAFELTAKTAELNINGSGNMEVTVEESLTAKISGSGDVRYKGRPAVNVDISGSGKLEDAN